MGKSYSTLHAADLAAELPLVCRVHEAIDPTCAWGWQEYLLVDIANSLRRFASKKNQLLKPPKRKHKQGEAFLSKGDYIRALNLPRKEV
jgi:hypothetical protein